LTSIVVTTSLPLIVTPLILSSVVRNAVERFAFEPVR
jgi:hypothetical protein